ncbi:hypothetical protein GUJ93_ZPchr0458g22865 [Zizania palustris]|uniref:Uncharacterized protein n=1 Tax=Zizania palustris TaxID=103762 RepID=A0A8J5UZS1_ZIZPA|nr:hypothetical protein GUJ93_ZPchr0458g22865 [Zizania palustris]
MGSDWTGSYMKQSTTRSKMRSKLAHFFAFQQEMGGSMAGQSFHTATWTNKHCTSDGHCAGKAKMTLAHAEAKQQTQKHQSPERSNDATPQPKNRDEAEEANRGGAKEEQEAAAAAAAAATPRVTRPPHQEETTTSTYPDIFDISGMMDYSPATRKPPIHN